jgi:hypothetical protein
MAMRTAPDDAAYVRYYTFLRAFGLGRESGDWLAGELSERACVPSYGARHNYGHTLRGFDRGPYRRTGRNATRWYAPGGICDRLFHR